MSRPPESKYTSVYHDDMDRHPEVFSDERLAGAYLLLARRAGADHPHAATVPREVTDESFQRLAVLGIVESQGYGLYQMPEVAQRREDRSQRGRVDRLVGYHEAGKHASPVADCPLCSSPLVGGSKPPTTTSAAQHSAVQHSTVQTSAAQSRATDDDDYFDAYYQLTASAPSPKAVPWLNRLANEYGADRLIAALAAEWQKDPDRGTVLGRAQDRLWSEGRTLEKDREQRKRQAAAAEKARIEEMPLEVRQANLARLRASLVESGLMSQAQAERNVNGELDA